ncbi:MAG: restriction endonuclease subunit S [Methylocella sp.]
MSFSANLSELVASSDDPLLAAAKDWDRIDLKKVATILNGYPWRSDSFNDRVGAPVIRIRDVTSGQTKTFYDGLIASGYWIENGDLIVGMDGDFNCRIWNGGRALLNQRVCKITPDERQMVKSFLCYMLPGYLKAINDATHSITVKHLSSKTLGDIPLPSPPLSEQHRIVTKLDSLTGRTARARDELGRLPRLIQKYRAAILLAAFNGQLTRDWRSHNLPKDAQSYLVERQRLHDQRKVLGNLGRDEKSAMICPDEDLLLEIRLQEASTPLPSTWSWAALGQVFGVYIGATPSRKEARFWGGNVNWVSSGEVAFCRIKDTAETITHEGLANSSTRIHPPGTVLLGMIGEGKTRGQAAVLDVPACNNQNCAAIRVGEAAYTPEYLYWYLYFSYEETRNAGAGNNQPALNKDRVQKILFPLAPPAEAGVIAARIGEAFAWLDRLAAEHANASRLLPKLDQAILAKAFRGELVPQDPNDKPVELRGQADGEGSRDRPIRQSGRGSSVS